MASHDEERMAGASESWVPFRCPGCGAKLRIRAAYAHLRGRCPECGFRIDALRPRPAAFTPARPAGDDDSPGLEPIEEEWPESARLEAEATPGNYGMAETPKSWAEEPARKSATPSVDGYDLTDNWKPAAATPSRPPGEGYDVGRVSDLPADAPPPIVHELSRAELNPLREPPPPDHPMLSDVYGFPFHNGPNIRVWLLFTIGWGTAIIVATTTWFFFQLMMQGEKIGSITPLPMTALILVLLLTGLYGAPAFLAVVQESAAGNRDVRWPDDGVIERLLQLGYLFWLVICSAWPVGLVAFFAPDLLERWSVLIPLCAVPIVLFPLFLLSSLSAQRLVVLVHHKVVTQMLRRLPAVVGVWIVSAVLAAACLGLAFLCIVQLQYLLIPVTAPLWSAAILVYARLLGRLAWLISQGPTPRKSSSRRRPIKV
jgi:hypothetical protein